MVCSDNMNIFGYLKQEDNTPLSESEVIILENEIPIAKDKLFFKIIAKTGISTEHLLGLRIGDIHFQSQYFHIYDKKLVRNRIVVAPHEIFESFKYLAHKPVDDLVFGELTLYKLNNNLKEYTRKYIQREKTWHSVRLFYIFNCPKLNIPLEVCAENTGISPATLFKYYKHSPKELVDLINGQERIGEYKNSRNEIYDKSEMS